ncbi:flagellar hook assembly protein FlgD [Hyphobacterium marinum]|uniref:Basal-body rod modification protein FlgD n=1 Tax=Hyphobacterium marinum TaxID=3116574 RepID=A0ABU7LX95_9PROT|nr:flagellar hook capping FlgD N-terminal domain-containing protein [Hyphobacterium sp. Y6023]MEE2566194.1 flagellar hook capping FlgD N-terminal domain-containing protein [Hyphobacterium sp. Y6023]
MSEVDALGANFGQQTASSRASLADNFEMFLTLLTEQMKNQDPLNPLDSTEFVNQLVSFSSVEQQISANQNLESLLLVQSAAAQGAAVGFIGREATIATPQAVLENGEASWSYVVPEDVSDLSIVVKDQGGRVIGRFEGETTSGSHDFNWNGENANGTAMDDGVYELEITATRPDGSTANVDILSTSRVTGVDLSGSEVVVEMGAIRALLSSVRALREAPAA